MSLHKLPYTDPVRRPKGRRIAVLGGSFNPPHAGHLHIAREALKRLPVDMIWWLVSPQNPLKPTDDTCPFDERITAVRKMIAREPRMIATTFEDAHGLQVSADTIAALRQTFPDREFTWLMGSDSFASLLSWFRWREFAAGTAFAVMNRPGSDLAARTGIAAQKLKGQVTFVDCPRHPLSSTALRQEGGNVC